MELGADSPLNYTGTSFHTRQAISLQKTSIMPPKSLQATRDNAGGNSGTPKR